jgi:hypothetical protein
VFCSEFGGELAWREPPHEYPQPSTVELDHGEYTRNTENMVS